ncbi:hypothetical protein ACVMAJ_005197 [Bradyrhizobium sp. USDA 4448]
MQKALMEMNRQLHHVVSDITGATGMRIIRAVVAGERNPDVLAAYRTCDSIHRSRRSAQQSYAMTSRTRLRVGASLEIYDFYLAKMLDCDRKLEVLISALNSKGQDLWES